MKVEFSEVRGVKVVSVEGELTGLTAGTFFNQVVALRGKGAAKIVVDLHGLTYVDSTGAGQLWRTVESARGEGGEAVLAAAPPIVRKVLDMLGISGEVVMKDSVEDGIKHLGG